MPGYRTALGFVVAPILPAIFILLPALLMDEQIWETVWSVKFAALFVYPTAFILGLPLYLFLRWKGWNAYWLYLLAGPLMTCATYAIVIGPEWPVKAVLALAALWGAIATSAFWLIVRPDRNPHPALAQG